jgi:hypothetical protein
MIALWLVSQHDAVPAAVTNWPQPVSFEVGGPAPSEGYVNVGVPTSTGNPLANASDDISTCQRSFLGGCKAVPTNRRPSKENVFCRGHRITIPWSRLRYRVLEFAERMRGHWSQDSNSSERMRRNDHGPQRLGFWSQTQQSR